MEKLQAVRNKILDNAVWAKTTPTTPVLFSLYLLEILDEADFAVLEEFENEVGEAAAVQWYVELLAEMGLRLEDEEEVPSLSAKQA